MLVQVYFQGEAFLETLMPNFQDLGSNAEDKNLEAQVSCGFGDGYIFDA